MSMSRRCDIWLATDKKWYARLGNFEHAYEDHECTCYGPFDTETEATEKMKKLGNPGSANVNNWGTIPPPTFESKSVLKRKAVQRKRK